VASGRNQPDGARSCFACPSADRGLAFR
jgi:hypothetical protein